MDVLHDIGSDDCVEVGFHKIKDKINIFIVFSFEDVLQCDDIGVSVELL